MASSSKLIAIHILEILMRNASPQKRLNQNDIMRYLQDEYGENITRHTCSDYLKKMREAGYIEGKRGVYPVQYFSARELNALIDGILLSGNMPVKDATPLVQKLKNLSYQEMHDRMRNVVYLRGKTHAENERLHELIDTIDEAIENNVKVELHLDALAEGTADAHLCLEVDPYYIYAGNGKYYLLCCNDKQQVETFALSQIQQIRILAKPRSFIQSFSSEYDTDGGQQISEHQNIELRLPVRVIHHFEDRFGKQYAVRYNDGKECILAVATNENTVLDWALQHAEYVEILNPAELRQRIYNVLEGAVQKYRKQNDLS